MTIRLEVEALDDRIVPTVNVTNHTITDVLNNPSPLLPGQNLNNIPRVLGLPLPAQPNPNQNDPIANDPNNPFPGFNLNQLSALYNTLVDGLNEAADHVQSTLEHYSQARIAFRQLAGEYETLIQLYGGAGANLLLYEAVVNVNVAAENALNAINHYNGLVNQYTDLQEYLYSLMDNGTIPAVDLGEEPEQIEMDIIFLRDQDGFRPGIDGRVYA